MEHCVVCLENSDSSDVSKGIMCKKGHYLDNICLNNYLSNNILSQIYKLRQNRCQVECVFPGCEVYYDPIILYTRLYLRERSRYLSILTDVLNADIREMHRALLDTLVLHCPTCQTSVDPSPDACSAVMCLNCGGYYCNFCFEAFSEYASEKNRALAHAHVAGHHTAADPNDRSAFLPNDVLLAGPMHQLLLWISLFDAVIGIPAIQATMRGERKAGDFGLSGPSDGAKMAKYELNELLNGRLAMCAIGGIATQTVLTGHGFPYL